MTRTTYKTVLPREPVDVPMPRVGNTKGSRSAAVLLTFRSSKTGNMLAAYRADVRIGYVNHSPSRRPGSTAPPYIWETMLLQPNGGHYVGREATEQDAKDALITAFTAWLCHAQLKEI